MGPAPRPSSGLYLVHVTETFGTLTIYPDMIPISTAIARKLRETRKFFFRHPDGTGSAAEFISIDSLLPMMMRE